MEAGRAVSALKISTTKGRGDSIPDDESSRLDWFAYSSVNGYSPASSAESSTMDHRTFGVEYPLILGRIEEAVSIHNPLLQKVEELILGGAKCLSPCSEDEAYTVYSNRLDSDLLSGLSEDFSEVLPKSSRRKITARHSSSPSLGKSQMSFSEGRRSSQKISSESSTSTKTARRRETISTCSRSVAKDLLASSSSMSEENEIVFGSYDSASDDGRGLWGNTNLWEKWAPSYMKSPKKLSRKKSETKPMYHSPLRYDVVDTRDDDDQERVPSMKPKTRDMATQTSPNYGLPVKLASPQEQGIELTESQCRIVLNALSPTDENASGRPKQNRITKVSQRSPLTETPVLPLSCNSAGRPPKPPSAKASSSPQKLSTTLKVATDDLCPKVDSNPTSAHNSIHESISNKHILPSSSESTTLFKKQGFFSTRPKNVSNSGNKDNDRPRAMAVDKAGSNEKIGVDDTEVTMTNTETKPISISSFSRVEDHNSFGTENSLVQWEAFTLIETPDKTRLRITYMDGDGSSIEVNRESPTSTTLNSDGIEHSKDKPSSSQMSLQAVSSADVVKGGIEATHESLADAIEATHGSSMRASLSFSGNKVNQNNNSTLSDNHFGNAAAETATIVEGEKPDNKNEKDKLFTRNNYLNPQKWLFRGASNQRRAATEPISCCSLEEREEKFSAESNGPKTLGTTSRNVKLSSAKETSILKSLKRLSPKKKDRLRRKKEPFEATANALLDGYSLSIVDARQAGYEGKRRLGPLKTEGRIDDAGVFSPPPQNQAFTSDTNQSKLETGEENEALDDMPLKKRPPRNLTVVTAQQGKQKISPKKRFFLSKKSQHGTIEGQSIIVDKNSQRSKLDGKDARSPQSDPSTIDATKNETIIPGKASRTRSLHVPGDSTTASSSEAVVSISKASEDQQTFLALLQSTKLERGTDDSADVSNATTNRQNAKCSLRETMSASPEIPTLDPPITVKRPLEAYKLMRSPGGSSLDPKKPSFRPSHRHNGTVLRNTEDGLVVVRNSKKEEKPVERVATPKEEPEAKSKSQNSAQHDDSDSLANLVLGPMIDTEKLIEAMSQLSDSPPSEHDSEQSSNTNLKELSAPQPIASIQNKVPSVNLNVNSPMKSPIKRALSLFSTRTYKKSQIMSSSCQSHAKANTFASEPEKEGDTDYGQVKTERATESTISRAPSTLSRVCSQKRNLSARKPRTKSPTKSPIKMALSCFSPRSSNASETTRQRSTSIKEGHQNSNHTSKLSSCGEEMSPHRAATASRTKSPLKRALSRVSVIGLKTSSLEKPSSASEFGGENFESKPAETSRQPQLTVSSSSKGIPLAKLAKSRTKSPIKRALSRISTGVSNESAKIKQPVSIEEAGGETFEGKPIEMAVTESTTHHNADSAIMVDTESRAFSDLGMSTKGTTVSVASSADSRAAKSREKLKAIRRSKGIDSARRRAVLGNLATIEEHKPSAKLLMELSNEMKQTRKMVLQHSRETPLFKDDESCRGSNLAMSVEEKHSRLSAKQLMDLKNEIRKHKEASQLEQEVDCSGTVATTISGLSAISSASRLTTAEEKIARRLKKDLKMLAKIEKKRRGFGKLEAGSTAAEVHKSLSRLKSKMEESRREEGAIAALRDSDPIASRVYTPPKGKKNGQTHYFDLNTWFSESGK